MEELRRTAPALRTRLIPYSAVGTPNGLLLAVRLDAALVDGKPAEARLLAFSPNDLSDGAVFEAVL